MPVWKRTDDKGNSHFQFLCASCNENKKILLEQDAWVMIRDGDPASCNDCDLQCELTSRQLWGAEESIRYGVCGCCASYDRCPLRGRYYC